jgi:hypothetical protein
VELWEAASREEQHHGDGGKPSIGDWKAGTGGLLLRVFKVVDVLENTRVFGPSAKHGSLEMANLCDLETSTAGGKMVKVCLDGHLVEKGRGILEGQEPCFFHYGGEENAELVLDHADEVLEFELGSPHSL